MARICAFWGKNKVTKEHVFAKWVRDEYRHLANEPAVTTLQRDSSILWEHRADPLDMNIREFCKNCNSGWMSQLETKAGVILGPMLRGKQVPVRIGFVGQGNVASWATKTALVLQLLQHADNRIPNSYYHDFCARQQPSNRTIVLMSARHIAATSKGSNLLDYTGRFIGRGTSGIQQVHFAIGAVYFGVIMLIGNTQRVTALDLPDELAAQLSLIWPIMKPAVTWPPGSISLIGGVEGAFQVLTRTLQPVL